MCTDQTFTLHGEEAVLAVSLELAAAKWKVALHDGRRERPAVHTVAQPQAAARLQAVLDVIEQQKLKWSLPAGVRIVVSYEAGQDAFWICRALQARGIECYVVDPASIPVERHKRRAKTDQVEVDVPVCPLGCRRNRFLDGACHPDKIPAQPACRIGLANRQRIEGCATLDRLTSATTASRRDVNSIAAITGRHGMRLQVGERNTARSPTYASLSRLRSVKGRCAQASPALDPATALLYRGRPMGPGQ
jgi:hypothetical protein